MIVIDVKEVNKDGNRDEAGRITALPPVNTNANIQNTIIPGTNALAITNTPHNNHDNNIQQLQQQQQVCYNFYLIQYLVPYR